MVDSDLDKTTVVESNGEEAGGVEERSNEGGEKGTNKMEADPKIEHKPTRSVEDTLTVAQPDATESEVFHVP